MNLPLSERDLGPAEESLPSSGLATSFERRRLRFYLVQILLDIASLAAAFLLATPLLGGGLIGVPLRTAGQLLVPLFLTIALQNGTYSLESLRDWSVASTKSSVALSVSAVLLYFILSFSRFNWLFARGAFLLAIVLSLALMITVRRLAFLWMCRHWGSDPLNVLVIDDEGPTIDLPGAYRVNARERGLEPTLADPHMLDLLARYVRNMDQVIVSCPAERRIAWALVLKGSGIHGEVLFDYVNEIGALGVVNRGDIGITTLLVSSGPLGLRARAMKRVLDIGISAVTLVLVSPILLVACVAIKLEDRGPLMFKQMRVGRRNQLFSIYKLRTMKVAKADGDGNRSASKGDDRVTRVGRFLRRTSIDELPQLFNVLKGEMSLVGPRPHAIGSLAGEKLFWEVDHRYWQRHTLRPGLTGLAQVRGFRGATDRETDLTSRLQADLEYLAGWTVWRDLRILVATTRVLVHDRAF
jgi:lipopolysaccharide/colanic/teichoic acid biosynthesis glycosyltransferase